jgi:hypothetical protein
LIFQLHFKSSEHADVQTFSAHANTCDDCNVMTFEVVSLRYAAAPHSRDARPGRGVAAALALM